MLALSHGYEIERGTGMVTIEHEGHAQEEVENLNHPAIVTKGTSLTGRAKALADPRA